MFLQYLHEIIQHPIASLLVIVNIVLLEAILSIDNAAVLATMVMDLPKNQQAKVPAPQAKITMEGEGEDYLDKYGFMIKRKFARMEESGWFSATEEEGLEKHHHYEICNSMNINEYISECGMIICHSYL